MLRIKALKFFSILILTGGIFSSQNIQAQRDKGEEVLSLGAGLSYWNLLMGFVGDSLITTSTPTFDLTYDYGITHNFSIGAAVSYNSFSFINPRYSYVNSSGVIIYESISVKYSLVNVAIRPLYHWGKKENFEWHTGLRMGYGFWNAKLNTTDPYYKDEFYRKDVYQIQVLFGSRAYFSEYMAITFDVGLGSPYFASIGLSLKL